MAKMSKMKEHLANLVLKTKDALEYNSIDDMKSEELNDVNGHEWVIVIGSTIIEDGFTEQSVADDVIKLIKHELDEEALEQTNDNGSLLNPDTVTYCNDCHNSVHKEVQACPECGSPSVEHILE